jgi:hypothetical protein
MPTNPKDLARSSCDAALAQCIGKITSVLLDDLATAGEDGTQVDACKERYLKGMKLCKEAYQISLDTVNSVF